jgi:hypothetical protein
MTEFYNFTKGKTAEFLTKTRGLKFEAFRNVEFLQVTGLQFDPTKIFFDDDGCAILRKGEERQLLFYYKLHFHTHWLGTRRLPRFHILNCETRQEYSGYVFANKMPVPVISRDTQKSSVEKLELCKNCKRAAYKNLWRSNNHTWYEAVLDYVQNQSAPVFQTNGYHAMWSQVSEAYREKMNFRCESCGIDLSVQSEKQWLHTHHVNGDKRDNRTSNFQALCLLCHGLKHTEQLKHGTAFYRVQEFIDIHRSRLNQLHIEKYRTIIRESRPYLLRSKGSPPLQISSIEYQ